MGTIRHLALHWEEGSGRTVINFGFVAYQQHGATALLLVAHSTHKVEYIASNRYPWHQYRSLVQKDRGCNTRQHEDNHFTLVLGIFLDVI